MSDLERLTKPIAVLEALNEEPMTPDEYVTKRGWYINSWAPTFTHLRQAGLIERTGERRVTSHGSTANVLRVTAQGRARLSSLRKQVRDLEQQEAAA